jgi:hypothetical protein
MGSGGHPHLCQGLRRGQVKALRCLGYDNPLQSSAIQTSRCTERSGNFLVTDARRTWVVFALPSTSYLQNIQ